MFKKHGLKMSLEKAEMMRFGHKKEDSNIRLGGKEIQQVDGFVYLEGMATKDGYSEVGVRRRIQAIANAWRKEEGVMLYRYISKIAKRKSLETVTLTEQQQQQQQNLQV